jgi:PadR family transcriptional regulator AphA
MQHEVLQAQGAPVVSGVSGAPLLARVGDVIELLGLCAEHDTSRVLVYPSNLTPGFFELRTQEAGEVLQKLRTYRVRLALVVAASELPEGHFTEMAREEGRSRDFAVFDSRDEALDWLALD